VTLNGRAVVAKQVLAFLEAQGYVEPSGRGEWLTTAAGDAVSGSKPPRYTPDSVAAALSELAARIRTVHEDQDTQFKMAAAVTLGDFLNGRARVQAPDVGVQLTPRGRGGTTPNRRSSRRAAHVPGVNLKGSVLS
jgi:hypothetical protein